MSVNLYYTQRIRGFQQIENISITRDIKHKGDLIFWHKPSKRQNNLIKIWIFRFRMVEISKNKDYISPVSEKNRKPDILFFNNKNEVRNENFQLRSCGIIRNCTHPSLRVCSNKSL